MLALLIETEVQAKLSDLPVVGGYVPTETDVGVTALRMTASSKPPSDDQVDKVNTLIGKVESGGTKLPRLTKRNPPARLSLGATLKVPGQADPLPVEVSLGTAPEPGPGTTVSHAGVAPYGATFGLTPQQDGVLRPTAVFPPGAPLPGDPRIPAPEGPVNAAADGGVAGTAGAGGGGLQAWVSVQRTLGPLTLHRVGVAYAKSDLWVLFDIGLGLAGLTLSADGLGFGIPLSRAGTPAARLDGLGVDYRNPPIEAGGALLNTPSQEYDPFIQGMVVVRTPAITLEAVGAYARKTADPAFSSFFLFGALGGKGIGPPPFRVRGVAAGFGYNDHLTVPKRDQVATFPLLTMLPEENPGEVDPNRDPMEVLRSLHDSWLTPSQGEMWLAAGLAFTSFELVSARALLILEFGHGFTLALLGSASASFPSSASVPGVTPYAEVELELEAVYSTQTATLAVDAMLTDRSYVLSRDCKLRGGFAFHLWFPGSGHEGDFVLTLGGYHPKFSPPAHYPQVPRLGIDWSPTSSVSVRGDAYFALTPGAIMAGGALDVRYSSSRVRAWLQAHADMLIQWSPFHFEVGIGVSVGASIDLWLFTANVEVGADLDLWGPPTGGTATVHACGISFTIGFGADREGQQTTIGWDRFQKELLPETGPLTLTPTSGLVNGPKQEDPNAPLRMSSADCGFTTHTAVPATRLTVCGAEQELPTAESPVIGPMGDAGRDLRSVHTVVLEHHDQGEWKPVAADSWDITPVTGSAPAALWRAPSSTVTSPDRHLMPGQTTGVRVRVKAPTVVGATHEVSGENLQHTPLPDAANYPLGLTSGGAAHVVDPPEGVLATIRTTVASRAQRRGDLRAALAQRFLDPGDDDTMRALAARTGHVFTATPRVAVVPTSAQGSTG